MEAAGGRARRRADGGAAASGGVETAADRRAGYVETPPSAAVRRRTVGQSPPPLRRTGRPGRSGRLRNEVCQTPSYPPRSAIGGTPGAPTWTSSDPGPAPSLCAVPAIQLGQHHPRATALTPWPGGLAGEP